VSRPQNVAFPRSPPVTQPEKKGEEKKKIRSANCNQKDLVSLRHRIKFLALLKQERSEKKEKRKKGKRRGKKKKDRTRQRRTPALFCRSPTRRRILQEGERKAQAKGTILLYRLHTNGHRKGERKGKQKRKKGEEDLNFQLIPSLKLPLRVRGRGEEKGKKKGSRSAGQVERSFKT